jgi:membrane protease YdiL (CAAX protease family)
VTGLLTVLGSGFLFGLVHFAEGPMGLVSNGAFGLLFGWIYLKSGRNLWITIIAHGLLNTLRFVLVFSGAA